MASRKAVHLLLGTEQNYEEVDIMRNFRFWVLAPPIFAAKVKFGDQSSATRCVDSSGSRRPIYAYKLSMARFDIRLAVVRPTYVTNPTSPPSLSHGDKSVLRQANGSARGDGGTACTSTQATPQPLASMQAFSPRGINREQGSAASPNKPSGVKHEITDVCKV
jgi:hypothetical protein